LNMPVAEGFRRLRRIGHNEAGVAVRQVHAQEMDLALHPANDAQRFAKIGLGMSRRMRQRNEHLLATLVPAGHVVLHDRHPAGKAVLVPKPLVDPLRGMPLLGRASLVLIQDPLDDPDERLQLRSHRWLPATVTRRNREHHHLANSPRIDPEPACRLAMAQSLNLHRIADPSV
jgi:hypothetical protein